MFTFFLFNLSIILFNLVSIDVRIVTCLNDVFGFRYRPIAFHLYSKVSQFPQTIQLDWGKSEEGDTTPKARFTN